MKRNIVILLSVATLMFSSPIPTHSAEYNGRNIDGERFSANAYSYDTSKWYNVTVVFDGDEARIRFSNGHTLKLDLDDEEIDDPHNISAYDYDHSVYWDLDVDGVD